MAKIILAVAMLSAVVVSNVAHADGFNGQAGGQYIPGQNFDTTGGFNVDEYQH